MVVDGGIAGPASASGLGVPVAVFTNTNGDIEGRPAGPGAALPTRVPAS